jgi:T5orf172 domain.
MEQTDTDYETRMLKLLDILDRVPPRPMFQPPTVTLKTTTSAEPTSHVVYFIQAGERIKIGISSRITKRLTALRTSSPVRLLVLGVIYAPCRASSRAIERELHKGFSWLSARGEWFADSPHLRNFIATYAHRWEGQ